MFELVSGNWFTATRGFELGSKSWVHPTVQDRVDTRATQGDPVTDKENGTVVVKHRGIGVEIRQNVVQIQWHPTNSKNNDHSNQQLNAPSLGVNLNGSLNFRDDAQVCSKPEFVHHATIR